MTSSCVSDIQKSAQRVRDLLISVKDGGQAVDSDLVFKEIKSDLKDSIYAYLSVADDDGTALLVAALNECVRTVTTEFFQTSTSNDPTLVLYKCVNMYLGFSSHMMDKMRTPQLYVAALCSRIQALEVVALLLLKQSRYSELEGYTKQLAEQIRCFKGVATDDAKSDKEKLRARHAESVLQVCRFAAMTSTAANSEAALESLYTAKNACCDDFPMLQKYVSSRAYVTGMQCFKSGHYKHSVSYFRESFCLGKKFVDVNRQAHTLYLLGSAYLLWDKQEHWEKAANALDMAIWHRPGQLNYMTKKMEALYQSGNDKQLSSTLDCILRHQEITIRHVLGIHQSIKEHGFVQQAIEFLQRAYIRFSQDREALYLLVELLKVELDSNELDRAFLTFQRILVQDSAKTTQFAGHCLRQLFCYLFRFGCGKAESGSTSEAVEWLRNCETLVATFKSIFDEENIRKQVDSLRLCQVYWSMNLGMTNRAKDTLDQYTGTDHVTKGYLRLKIALEEDNGADAIAAVRKLLQLVKEANRFERENIIKKVSNALIHVGSFTLKAGKLDLTKDVLKQMALPPETNPAMAEMQLKCLQCVVALCLINIEQVTNIYEEVSDCIEKAATILFVCENDRWHAEQSQWFATVCWNLALLPEVNAEQQFHLLGHSFRLMLSVHGRRDTTKRITTYAIMAMLSGVTASRKHVADTQLRQRILREVHQIAEKLKEVNPGWRDNRQLAGMLLAAEFEAIVCGGGAANGNAVTDEVISFSEDNPELLEQFVAICQDAGSRKSSLSVTLLRRCIDLTATQNQPDKLVKYYHLFFQALLDSRDEDGVVACTDEVIRLNHSVTFPETELVWMMTTVWNEGLQRYLEGALPSAKRYLSCALRIVDILPVLRAAYQQSLLSRYQGLLNDEIADLPVTNKDHQ
ncbi:testis-expressed protein 11-like [Dermacentor variabilis]|uniref:testis-expressed protein 11-like n=1 Tax=Dermacentor variabilis TaxID=34621 RepID=UPI003F5C0400